jgi:hypothetical protein
MAIIQFLFILLVPIVLVAGAVVTLFAVGALFDALDHPDETSSRIEAFFRGRPRPSKPAPADHYYKPYWSGAKGTTSGR